ncbi:MAG TPA: class II fructose-bisphosphatase [Terriglobales bacterium]|nr:class II fructose-bisphosphatase [Terriglobales bacterium]
MATTSLPATPAPQSVLELELSLELLGVVEQAAIASAKTMGQGDAKLSDQAAVESMRASLDHVPLQGTIVIGEGERDEAPMLFIGEKLGGGGAGAPAVDIAVDPLEGTNLCASGAPGSITVLAASESGGLLHAPDCYMEKIIVGPACRGAVDLDAPVKDNLAAIARRLDRKVDELVVVVLDRTRHEKLIGDIRATGARIHLIQDGDLSAGIATAVLGTGVHVVMGSGGAPEGVLTAAAMRCLHGEIVARLVVDKPGTVERLAKMGVKDPRRIYKTEDLAPGKSILFAACGVTSGSLLRGVRFFKDGTRTQSLVMAGAMNKVRFVDTIHVAASPDARIRFN